MRPVTSFLTVVLIAVPSAGQAQDSVLTLARARARVLAGSPEVAAARDAADVARGLERQAGAFTNPVVSWSREQTGDAATRNRQDVIAAEQYLERPGVRSARRSATRARREAAEARAAIVESRVVFDAVRAYALGIAARRRARLADTLAAAFARAAVVSERRLREGDIAGFAARRIRLEAARYAALRAAALQEERSADAALAIMLGDTARFSTATLVEPAVAPSAPLEIDSLLARALRFRPDIIAAAFDAEAARAERARAGAERFPGVALTAGSKRETVAGQGNLSGYVAGLALPLPFWDRRGGAVGAAEAEARQRGAELNAARMRVTREVIDAAEAYRAARAQLDALGPAVQSDAAATLRAAQTAYAEGEITLLEWLDTMRAYHETESAVATLRAELLIRAAALERATGVMLFEESR